MRPVVSWSLFWKVTNIYHVLFHYFVVKFSCLYKSVLLFTVQWKLVALIFPQNYLLKPTFWLLSSLFLSPIKCVGWTHSSVTVQLMLREILIIAALGYEVLVNCRKTLLKYLKCFSSWDVTRNESESSDGLSAKSKESLYCKQWKLC